MKRIAALVVIGLLWCGLAWAGEASPTAMGFQDIPFGSPYALVKEKLVKTYGGNIVEVGDLLAVNTYLGEIPVNVGFIFDHNMKFCAFQFMTTSETADKLETKIVSDGKYLTEIFQKKYGKAMRCFNPRVFDIRDGYTAYLCKWDKSALEIYTGIRTGDFQYYTVGFVGSKAMLKANQEYKESQLHKGTSNAVNSF